MADKQRRERNQLAQGRNSSAAVDSKDDATREKRDEEELQQARAQIQNLEAEQRDLLALKEASSKKMNNLKIEVEVYQHHVSNPGGTEELKQNYESKIKKLEAKIAAQKSDIATRKETIQNLCDENRQLNQEIEYVTADLKECKLQLRRNLRKLFDELKKEQRLQNAEKDNKTLENIRVELEEVLRQKGELEKSVQDSQRAVAAGFENEQRILQNLREAISMARDSIAEKEAAEKRQKNIEKECDSLAMTVGQIFDTAARNVEMDTEDLRKEFKKKERTLLNEKFELKEQIENQRKFYQILKKRCARLADKCKGGCQRVENLNKQLQSAVTALEEMKEEIEAQESSMRETILLKKRIEESKKELQHYKEKNVQEKQKYKSSRKDVTKKFENEIYQLRTENGNLKADKHFLEGEK